MSYDIFYDKQFVKLNDNTFIPMVLVGSNNCYDWNNKRSRSWSNFSFLLSFSIAGSMEQMLERQAKTRADKLEQYPDEYNDKSFGNYTSLSNGGRGCNMTYGQYLGIVKTGCKKALTIEQLKEERITLNVHTYNSNDTVEKLKEQGLEPVNFTPKSTEDMLDFIKNIEPKYKDKKEGSLYLSFSGMFESTPKWIRKKYFSTIKKEKQIIKSSIGYTIRIINKEKKSSIGYLYSYKGGTFRYTPYERSGKQYLIKKDAERIANKMEERRKSFKFEVVQVKYVEERIFRVTAGKKVILPVKEKTAKMTDEELINSLIIRNEGEEVVNMFDRSKKCFLEPIAVALHDFIKGCEVTEKYENMQQALSIFRRKYPKEYYVLLD